MAARPITGASLIRGLLDSNPFYLISACCMLGGCLALTNSLSWVSIPTPRLLIMIGTLNLYEAALIGLAAFLVLRRQLPRDGMMLLILEAFFLVDVTFLNSEIATRSLGLGIAVSGFVFAAAVLKLWVALRVLGLRQSAKEMSFILIQLATILLIPLIFTRIDHGTIPAFDFYAVWWLVGVMPALYALLCHLMPALDVEARVRSKVVTTYLALAWLSLIAHVGILHYVYDADYFGAYAAPMLIALAVLLRQVSHTPLMPRKDIITLQVLLPLAAILVSANNSQPLIEAFRQGRHTVTPFEIAICATYLAYIYLFLQRYWIQLVAAGAAALLALTFGPSPAQVQTLGMHWWNLMKQFAWRFSPKTTTDWGIVSVAASFGFLVLGAGVSLRKREI